MQIEQSRQQTIMAARVEYSYEQTIRADLLRGFIYLKCGARGSHSGQE
jgi:hypothetical protein